MNGYWRHVTMPASYTWDVYVNDTCTGANEKSTWISHSIKYKSTTCQVRISSLRRKPSQNTGPLIFRESFSLFYQTKSKCLELQQFFFGRSALCGSWTVRESDSPLDRMGDESDTSKIRLAHCPWVVTAIEFVQDFGGVGNSVWKL